MPNDAATPKNFGPLDRGRAAAVAAKGSLAFFPISPSCCCFSISPRPT